MITILTKYFRYDEETPSNSHLSVASREEECDDTGEQTEVNDEQDTIKENERESDKSNSNKGGEKKEDEPEEN